MSDERILPERYDAPPHDARWELEPRWSAEDRARCEAKRALLDAPGLASAKQVQPAAADKTGSE